MAFTMGGGRCFKYTRLVVCLVFTAGFTLLASFGLSSIDMLVYRQRRWLAAPQKSISSKVSEFSNSTMFAFNSTQFDFAREKEITEPLSVPIWGLELRQSSARQLAKFHVGVPCTKDACDELYVWFQGPSVFIASNITRNASAASVEYLAEDAGEYKVFVDVFSDFNGENVTIKRVVGSPFSLFVTHNGRNETHISLPSKICDNAKWQSGRWLPCTGPNCPRAGWAWVPHDCSFPFYPPPMLHTVSKPLWIVLAGSSVQRGTFFSIVDSILGARASNLTHSEFWKCWGVMDFKQGNFRVSYLDFREGYFFQTGSSMFYPEPGYFSNAMKVIRALTRQGVAPDVFYLEMEVGWNRQSWLEDLLIIKSWFGLAWKGRFMVQLQKPPFGVKGQSTAVFEKHSLITELENHPSLDIEYIDEQHMALPFYHEMEHFPFHHLPHRKSYHYHQACNEKGIHSCSKVSDMAAQQLLHVVFTKLSLDLLLPETSPSPANISEVPFEFCLSCPPSLVPFRIDTTRVLKPKCHSYLPKEKER